MKTIVMTALFVLSLPAFSAFNEVECEAKFENKDITLEIEQAFPSRTAFRSSTLTVSENGVETSFQNTLTLRPGHGFNRLSYSGGGLRLEIDLWPDNRPQWGRTYRSTLVSSDIGNSEIQNVDCTFSFVK